jgi:hypothetical protein
MSASDEKRQSQSDALDVEILAIAQRLHHAPGLCSIWQTLYNYTCSPISVPRTELISVLDCVERAISLPSRSNAQSNLRRILASISRSGDGNDVMLTPTFMIALEGNLFFCLFVSELEAIRDDLRVAHVTSKWWLLRAWSLALAQTELAASLQRE